MAGGPGQWSSVSETPGRKSKSGFLLHHFRARLVQEMPSASVSHLGNDDTSSFVNPFDRALHFAPSSRPLTLYKGPTRHPMPFHEWVIVAGPLLRRLAGEAAPTLESLSWVRESGQPGKKDQRTLTKQPTCKLMERKRKLLQVLRECTAVGRQAVVCGAGPGSLRLWPQFTLSGGALGGLWVSC